MSCECSDEAAGFHIPQHDGAILACTYDGFTIWTECPCAKPLRMSRERECSDVFTGFYIPQHDGAILGT